MLAEDIVDMLRRELRDDYCDTPRLAAGTLPTCLRRQVGYPPVESQSITPQGGEAVDLPFGRLRGFISRGRYHLNADD